MDMTALLYMNDDEDSGDEAVAKDDDNNNPFRSSSALQGDGAPTVRQRLLHVTEWTHSNYVINYNKVLGEGTFALVYQGERKSDGSTVAVKVINKALLMRPREKEAIQREYHILRNLPAHDNITTLLDAYEDHKNVYLVFKLKTRATVYRLIARGMPLNEPLARSIFYKLMRAVAFLHSHKIIHADVKPKNILIDDVLLEVPVSATPGRLELQRAASKKALRELDKEKCAQNEQQQQQSAGTGTQSPGEPRTYCNTVQLCDFGAAEQLDDAANEVFFQGVVGTGGYIAPEILDAKNYSFPIDVWSAGVVLYKMLYGIAPFSNQDFQQLQFPKEPKISEEAEHLLRSILTADIKSRPTAAQVLRHRWLAPEVERGASSPPTTSTSSPTSRSISRVSDDEKDEDDSIDGAGVLVGGCTLDDLASASPTVTPSTNSSRASSGSSMSPSSSGSPPRHSMPPPPSLSVASPTRRSVQQTDNMVSSPSRQPREVSDSLLPRANTASPARVQPLKPLNLGGANQNYSAAAGGIENARGSLNVVQQSIHSGGGGSGGSTSAGSSGGYQSADSTAKPAGNSASATSVASPRTGQSAAASASSASTSTSASSTAAVPPTLQRPPSYLGGLDMENMAYGEGSVSSDEEDDL